MDDVTRYSPTGDETVSITNGIQLGFEFFSNKKLPKSFTKVMSGKLGAVASFTNLMRKYKHGTDTVSNRLAVSAGPTKRVAGYTGNPVMSGIAMVAGSPLSMEDFLLTGESDEI
ncbi:hypothetical protein [Edaphovirga cremea]|uniref:hypothetical protein n=1 Tax=Edaphovirga cremea TaxID=2267246 RepID=UPI003989207E